MLVWQRFLIALCTIVVSFPLHGQQFWQLANGFEGGPKVGITLSSNSCLLAGVIDGVFMSCDEGQSFDRVLQSGALFSVYTSSGDIVFAGGAGMIFRSADQGLTWDSLSLGHTFPVTQFVENSGGELFAITGVLDIDLGYLGAGVYFSGDEGISWEQRNTGLGGYLSCERIAVDKNDRLYLGLADEFVTGNAGLFVSDDKGMSWQHIEIFIDGRGVIDDKIKIGNTHGLSISPHDSLYFSFSGTAVNVGVTLNVCKHIDDVGKSSHWRVMKVFDSVSWWLDRPLQGIHFASNGDWYSSARGSVNSGGTYFTENAGSTWTLINTGIGIDLFGRRNIQSFAELPTGRIFMTQLLDELVYYTDTSVVTSIQEYPVKTFSQVSIYPNPAKPGTELRFGFPITDQMVEIRILDMAGKIIPIAYFQGGVNAFYSPIQPGFYTGYLTLPDKTLGFRFIVLDQTH